MCSYLIFFSCDGAKFQFTRYLRTYLPAYVPYLPLSTCLSHNTSACSLATALVSCLLTRNSLIFWVHFSLKQTITSLSTMAGDGMDIETAELKLKSMDHAEQHYFKRSVPALLAVSSR